MSRIYTEEIDRAEETRKRYLYSKLIMSGKISLPYRVATRLCGPDRAYHLYKIAKNSGKPKFSV